MKKHIIVLTTLLLLFPSALWAWGVTTIGSGNTCDYDTCRAQCMMFSWDCSSTDVTSGGCSLGDTSATASGAASEITFTGGKVQLVDTLNNGNDYYHFDISSSFDIFPSGGVTVTFTVNYTTINTDSRIWTIWIDASNVVVFRFKATNDLNLFYTASGSTVNKTFDTNLSTSTDYAIVVKASMTRGMEIKVNGTPYTDSTALSRLVHDGSATLYVGNSDTPVTKGTIDNFKIYYGWRDDL